MFSDESSLGAYSFDWLVKSYYSTTMVLQGTEESELDLNT